MRPCNHAPLICGNLLEQSVEEVWQSEAMQGWRNMLPKPCEACLDLSKCHGGCRAVAMDLGLAKDPLIGQLVLERVGKPPEELVLYEGARPLARFTIRPEPFGYALVRGNRVVPVTHQAKPILDVLDGQMTLHQIEERFGSTALSFLGSLYKKGLIAFESDTVCDQTHDFSSRERAVKKERLRPLLLL